MRGPHRSRSGIPEQAFGSVAMGGRFQAVMLNTGDLSLEEGDAFAQFFLGIGSQILRREEAGGIARSRANDRSGTVVVHA